ncbi:hypothetical protein L7F22_049882 [Adiantum nelumboides]|nr:hypothetical protein [Adiantum nelumboides]
MVDSLRAIYYDDEVLSSVGNLYKSGRRASNAGTSQRSSEESVTNARTVLEPIVEDSIESSLTFSMASGTPTTSTDMHGPFSMVFNVRLAFAHINQHGVELYRDPMNRWIVQFDPAPFVNYQGEAYMGQEGDHYVVTNEPENADKWGQQVLVEKLEEPPFGESPKMRVLNALKVTHIPVDDLSLAVYKRETVESNHVYFAKDPSPQTIAQEKVLYIYLNLTHNAETLSYSFISVTSKASGLKELPSFVDENGSDKEVLRVPSQYQPSPMVLDTANLQALLSTPAKVTLTMAEILKVKPELCQEVTTCLNKDGYKHAK